jgi:hypothetical protein
MGCNKIFFVVIYLNKILFSITLLKHARLPPVFTLIIIGNCNYSFVYVCVCVCVIGCSVNTEYDLLKPFEEWRIHFRNSKFMSIFLVHFYAVDVPCNWK